jgi:hypothetical protein
MGLSQISGVDGSSGVVVDFVASGSEWRKPVAEIGSNECNASLPVFALWVPDIDTETLETRRRSGLHHVAGPVTQAQNRTFGGAEQRNGVDCHFGISPLPVHLETVSRDTPSLRASGAFQRAPNSTSRHMMKRSVSESVMLWSRSVRAISGITGTPA